MTNRGYYNFAVLIPIFFATISFYYYWRDTKILAEHEIVKAKVVKEFYGKRKSMHLQFENKIYSVDVSIKLLDSVEVGSDVEVFYNRELDEMLNPQKKSGYLFGFGIFWSLLSLYLIYFLFRKYKIGYLIKSNKLAIIIFTISIILIGGLCIWVCCSTLLRTHTSNQPLDSLSVTYYKNGQKESAGYFRGKNKDGEWTEWYENGNLKMVGNYKNNKMNGRFYYYYEDGTKDSEMEYVDDVIDGESTSFFPNGKIHSTGTFKNGEPDGIYKDFYENGIVRETGLAKNGKEEGEWIYYDTLGRIVFKDYYENGILIRSDSINPNDNLKTTRVR